MREDGKHEHTDTSLSMFGRVLTCGSFSNMPMTTMNIQAVVKVPCYVQPLSPAPLGSSRHTIVNSMNQSSIPNDRIITARTLTRMVTAIQVMHRKAIPRLMNLSGAVECGFTVGRAWLRSLALDTAALAIASVTRKHNMCILKKMESKHNEWMRDRREKIDNACVLYANDRVSRCQPGG